MLARPDRKALQLGGARHFVAYLAAFTPSSFSPIAIFDRELKEKSCSRAF